jgi:hypothetical protein
MIRGDSMTRIPSEGLNREHQKDTPGEDDPPVRRIHVFDSKGFGNSSQNTTVCMIYCLVLD